MTLKQLDRFTMPARYSIRQLLFTVMAVALLVTTIGAILKSRWQQAEIQILENSLEVTWKESSILTNAILQCETNSNFSHLGVANFLQSFAGNEFDVNLTNIFHGKDSDSILLVAIRADFPGEDYLSKYGNKDLGRTALFVYNHSKHTVIDAMLAEDYSGCSVSAGKTLGYELSLSDSAVGVIATRDGFIEEKKGKLR